MDRRQALKLLGALGAAGMASACSLSVDGDSGGGSNSPVKIGFLVPQNGAYKAIGDEMRNGFQLFLDQSGGKLGGHPIDLIFADEGDSVRSGQAGLKQLLDRKVHALAGVARSSVAAEIAGTVLQAQVPLVGCGGAGGSFGVFLWHTSSEDNVPGQALGRYLDERVPRGAGRIAVVSSKDPMEEAFVGGITFHIGREDPRIAQSFIEVERAARPGNSFYADTINQIRTMGATAVCVTLEGAAATAFVKQLRAARLDLRHGIYAPGYFVEGKALTGLGESGRDIFTVGNYSTDLDNSTNLRFVAAYRQAYSHSPSTFAVAAYDSAAVLDKAIALAGDSITPAAINRALSNVGQIASPRGAWQFSGRRAPLQTWYLRQVRKDGQVLANVVLREVATLG